MRASIILVFSTSAALASPLDLRTAESLYIDKSFTLKSDHESIRIAQENAGAHIGTILPKLDVKQDIEEKKIPTTSLTVKESVPYPTDWWKQYKIRNNTVAIATRTKFFNRQKAINELRKLYFTIKLLEKQRETVVKNVSFVENFRKESWERFSKGFIPESERQRADIDLLDLQQRLLKIDSDLHSAREQLAIRLESEETALSLSTPMLLSKNFIALKEETLRKNLNMQESDDIAIRKLQSENAELQVESFPYRYLPEIGLQAQVPVDRQRTAPTYSASLTWNLFKGGIDRTEHRKTLWAREQSAHDFHKKMQDFNIEGERLVTQILERKSRYTFQNDALKMWDNIVATSQRRFQAGAISSKDLSQDIRSYLDQADLLHQTTFDALSSLADFSLLVGKEELFYEFLF